MFFLWFTLIFLTLMYKLCFLHRTFDVGEESIIASSLFAAVTAIAGFNGFAQCIIFFGITMLFLMIDLFVSTSTDVYICEAVIVASAGLNDGVFLILWNGRLCYGVSEAKRRYIPGAAVSVISQTTNGCIFI